MGLNGMADDQPKRDDQLLPLGRLPPPAVFDEVVMGHVVFLHGCPGEAARGGVIGEAGGQGLTPLAFDVDILDLMFPCAGLGTVGDTVRQLDGHRLIQHQREVREGLFQGDFGGSERGQAQGKQRGGQQDEMGGTAGAS